MLDVRYIRLVHMYISVGNMSHGGGNGLDLLKCSLSVNEGANCIYETWYGVMWLGG